MVESSKSKRSREVASSSSALRPGVMLVRLHDHEARRKGLQLHFQVTTDPVDFVAKAVVVPASAGKGHVVLAPTVDTDFSLSAMVAVAFMGGFFATPGDFIMKRDTSPRGIIYKELYKSSKQKWHVAVTASVANEFPTLPQLLRSIAHAPGSCCNFYLSDNNLRKFFTKALRTSSRALLLQRTCVLAMPSDHAAAAKDYKDLYLTPRGFLLKFKAAEGDVCPGWRASPTS